MRLLQRWSTWALCAGLVACGGEDGGSKIGNKGGSSATGGAGGIKDGGGNSGGTIITSGGAGGGTGGQGTGGTLGEDAKICGGVEAAVETKPFNMLILFDQSVSMADFLDGVAPPRRWDAVTTALIEFFQSNEAKSLSIGLAYFEQIDPTTFNTSCREQDYATPEVEIAPMSDPAQVIRLVESINKHAPTGLTPTAPALKAALTHAKNYTMTHPGRETMVVLATDGIPTQCTPQQSTEIGQQIAAPFFAGVPSVRTFVVAAGLPGSLSALKYISMAGGTGQPVFTSDPKTTSQQIRDSFSRLTRTNLACSYRIPPGTDGGRTDPNQVNVEIRVQGQPDKRLPLYSTQANCGDGWYYDNPMKPENIMLCPSTCQSIFNGEVRILVGCAAPPPM
ncbi:MAG: hypothetical protein ABW133_20810 [Polyangiaceae bacterium]